MKRGMRSHRFLEDLLAPACDEASAAAADVTVCVSVDTLKSWLRSVTGNAPGRDIRW
jgi:hypothetical protein